MCTRGRKENIVIAITEKICTTIAEETISANAHLLVSPKIQG